MCGSHHHRVDIGLSQLGHDQSLSIDTHRDGLQTGALDS